MVSPKLSHIRKFSTVLAIIFMVTASPSYSSDLGSTIDQWLDPALQSKKALALEVLADLRKESKTRTPPRTANEDFGYTFMPGSKFDYICLSFIAGKAATSDHRIRVIDCGCGLGSMATLAVLAGGKVDAVDFRETVAMANKTIYTNTKKVIGYEAKDHKNYYRAFPCSLVSETEPEWTKTKHLHGYCRDVLHFFTEKDMRIFTKRIYDNIEFDGAFMVQADTPFFNALAWSYYQIREGKTLCPGLGIYSKKKGSKGLDLTGPPLPYDEACGLRPGIIYDGTYTSTGEVIDLDDYYHNVKNQFTVKGLSYIFAQVGFKTIHAFYMDDEGRMLDENQQPAIGKPSKACVLLYKPVK